MASSHARPEAHQPGTSESVHRSVLPQEVLDHLQPRPGGTFIDGTAGGGGHSQALLRATSPNGRVLCLDADADAVARVAALLSPFGDRATVVHANFRDLAMVADREGFPEVDGILLDLGLSSDQLSNPSRGFSLMADGPLDMRFDTASGQTAADLLNSLGEAELANLLYRYGEERQSRRIARAIVTARPLDTTSQLVAVIDRTVGRRGKIHPATRTFQALRIAVNQELVALTNVLPQALDLLRPGGRLAVIAFHSLEDRIVKQFMRQESQDCLCPPEVLICSCQHRALLKRVTRKPVQPSAAEVAGNPRSRSARLRVAERLPGDEQRPAGDSRKDRAIYHD